MQPTPTRNTPPHEEREREREKRKEKKRPKKKRENSFRVFKPFFFRVSIEPGLGFRVTPRKRRVILLT